MRSRNKKVSSNLGGYTPHQQVGLGFMVVCVIAVLYAVFVPQPKISNSPVIDDGAILVHNGMGHQFKHGRNALFADKTNGQVKSYFMSSLSDTN